MDIFLIIACGVVAGFFNVAAAGGSLLTLPMLIFLGVPPLVANATNRVALVVQNVVSVSTYASKDLLSVRYSLMLGVSSTLGALVGAYIVVDLSDVFINRLLSVMMLVALVLISVVPTKAHCVVAFENIKHKGLGVLLFFFIGIYGGLLHAGVGFIIVLVLVRINGLSLLTANSIKVSVALIYMIPVLFVFISKGLIDWKIALFLSIGNAFGGWLGSTFSIKKGEVWIKRILIVALVILSISLWFK